MSKQLKMAFGVAALIVTGTVIAALAIKPAPEVWSKAEHLRQLIGLGVAAVVLTFVVASIERPHPPGG